MAVHLFVPDSVCSETRILECGGLVRWRTKGGMGEREDATLWLGLGFMPDTPHSFLLTQPQCRCEQFSCACLGAQCALSLLLL